MSVGVSIIVSRVRRTAVSLMVTFTLVLVSIVPVGAQAATPTILPAVADPIILQHPNLFPEDIAYDSASDRFFVSSLGEGTVYTVSSSGDLIPFVTEQNTLSSLGLTIDSPNKRLLVANSDLSFLWGNAESLGKAVLVIYDLITGEKLDSVDLTSVGPAGIHIANDVTVDASGNTYITDSFAPVIYKVDQAGHGSVFATDPRFTSSSIGLNGIAYHPDGFLLTTMTDPGKLFKIPLDDPEAVAEVALDAPLAGIDNITLDAQGNLIGVMGCAAPAPRVVTLTSNDHWKTARIVQQAAIESPATGVAIRSDAVYVTYGNACSFIGRQDVNEFPIVRADMEQVTGASG